MVELLEQMEKFADAIMQARNLTEFCNEEQ